MQMFAKVIWTIIILNIIISCKKNNDDPNPSNSLVSIEANKRFQIINIENLDTIIWYEFKEPNQISRIKILNNIYSAKYDGSKSMLKKLISEEHEISFNNFDSSFTNTLITGPKTYFFTYSLNEEGNFNFINESFGGDGNIVNTNISLKYIDDKISIEYRYSDGPASDVNYYGYTLSTGNKINYFNLIFENKVKAYLAHSNLWMFEQSMVENYIAEKRQSASIGSRSESFYSFSFDEDGKPNSLKVNSFVLETHPTNGTVLDTVSKWTNEFYIQIFNL